MFGKSRYGIVRAVAVRSARAQVSRGTDDGIALLTLFCKTRRCTAANAVRNRCAGMCATRTAMRVNCARSLHVGCATRAVHVGCATWAVPPGLCPVGCATWAMPRGLCHVDATWAVHVGCATWAVPPGLCTWAVPPELCTWAVGRASARLFATDRQAQACRAGMRDAERARPPANARVNRYPLLLSNPELP
jgi:hypothetical protein